MSNKEVVNDLHMTDAEIASQVKHPTGQEGIALIHKHNAGNQAMVKKAYELLQPEGKTVLEIGFGNGIHFNEMLNTYPGMELTGLELSATMIEDCMKINADLIASKKLEVEHGDLLINNFSSQSFDSVVTINTIYYWGNTLQALGKIYELIKSGGTLVLAFRPKDNIEHISYIRYGIDHLGFQLYDLSEMLSMLTASGFIDLYAVRQNDSMVLTDNNGVDIALESCIILARKT